MLNADITLPPEDQARLNEVFTALAAGSKDERSLGEEFQEKVQHVILLEAHDMCVRTPPGVKFYGIYDASQNEFQLARHLDLDDRKRALNFALECAIHEKSGMYQITSRGYAPDNEEVPSEEAVRAQLARLDV